MNFSPVPGRAPRQKADWSWLGTSSCAELQATCSNAFLGTSVTCFGTLWTAPEKAYFEGGAKRKLRSSKRKPTQIIVGARTLSDRLLHTTKLPFDPTLYTSASTDPGGPLYWVRTERKGERQRQAPTHGAPRRNRGHHKTISVPPGEPEGVALALEPVVGEQMANMIYWL